MSTRHGWNLGVAGAALVALTAAGSVHNPRAVGTASAADGTSTQAFKMLCLLDRLLVDRGQTITFTIEPDLAASMAVVR